MCKLIDSFFCHLFLFQEFVQMIDKLETAFIRFVHFSNENELRSRVSNLFLSKIKNMNVYFRVEIIL